VADAVVSDQALGKANERQTTWALIWKGRSFMDARQYEEAIEPLQMASALASQSHPELAYEAEYVLGEVSAFQANNVGPGPEVEDLRRLYHELALEHYQAAFEFARQGKRDLDRPRLALAAEMAHLGMRGKAIAWLREGIPDPGVLAHTDIRLVSRMKSYMSQQEAEAWHEYLLDPIGNADPARPYFEAEFGATEQEVVSPVQDHQFQRLYWLARLRHSQRRRQDARSLYEQAAAAASSHAERAEALGGIVELQSDLLRRYRSSQRISLAHKRAQELVPLASRASTIWADMAKNGSSGEAHYAIEQAVLIWHRLGLDEFALRYAESLLSEIEKTGSSDKVAFARHMRLWALSWNERYSEAIDEAILLDAEYASDDDSDLTAIRDHALLLAAKMYPRIGDPQAGLNLIDTVRQRSPEREMELWADRYESIVNRHTGVGQ
jgi:hypothetical protein